MCSMHRQPAQKRAAPSRPITPATPIADEAERLEAAPLLLLVAVDDVALEACEALEPAVVEAVLSVAMSQYSPRHIQRRKLAQR
jgi:hypothetical protein